MIAGGDTRQASVQLGLAALEGVSLVAVQDGARPFATPQLIDRVVRAAHTYGAAAPAIGVKDTVKVAKGGVVSGRRTGPASLRSRRPRCLILTFCGGRCPRRRKTAPQ